MQKLTTLATALILSTLSLHAQDAPPPDPSQTGAHAPVVAQLADVLSRAAEGHSPSADDILAVESASGTTDADTARALAPLLDKALTNADGAVRQYGLAMLIGLEMLPDNAQKSAAGAAVQPIPQTPQASLAKPGQPLPPPPTQPAFEGKVGDTLAPLVPDIAARLKDDIPDVRNLAAAVLGGFAPNPPASVYPPIYAWLKRDDAIGDTGVTLATDLLRFAPLADASVAAISAYVRRSDQTSDSRASLVEAIAAQPQQSPAVNHALLSYLDSDDPALRARVILSLPQLDLSRNDFEDARGRVQVLAASDSQAPPPVISAARAVTTCWRETRMTAGCPTY